MARSKVSYFGETLIDLTSDTVTADKMLSGTTAHDKTGTKITGNVVVTNYYTGAGEPSPALGSDGDVYFQIS